MSYKFVATLTLMLDMLMLANALNRVFQCTHVPIKTSMEEVDRFVAHVEHLYLGQDIIAPTWLELQRQRDGKDTFAWRVKADGPSVEDITYVDSEHQYVVEQARMFAQFVVNEMRKRFPTDSIIHALAVFDWRSLRFGLGFRVGLGFRSLTRT